MSTPAHWAAKATTVRAWNTSWKPNTVGDGFGRLKPYTSAPSTYASPPESTSTVIGTLAAKNCGSSPSAAQPRTR